VSERRDGDRTASASEQSDHFVRDIVSDGDQVPETGFEELAAAGEAGIAAAATSFMPTGVPLIQNGGALIVFGAVFSTITALSAVVIASSRVAFSMGREGQLLPSIGRIHYRFGTPFVAVLLSAVVMLGSVVLPTQSAGNMSSLFFLLSFIVVNVAVIRLRRKRPNMNRPYEIPYYPIPPILGIALNGVLAVVLIGFLVRTDLLALLLSAGGLAAGGVMYVALNRYRARGTDGAGSTAGEPIRDESAE